MLLSESLLRDDYDHIVGGYGSLPATFKDAFEAAINLGTKPELHKAFLLLDRWRFAHKTRDVQMKEYRTLQENYEHSLGTKFIMGVNPEDLADLIVPEGVNTQEWLQVILPLPPNGLQSIAPEKAYRE